MRRRWLAYRDAFERAGIEIEVAGWPKSRVVRRESLTRAGSADAVVVASRLLSVRHTRALRQRAPRLLFDYDDALPFRDTRRGATRSRTRGRRFRALLAASDRVTAGNPYLVGLATPHGVDALHVPTTVVVPDAPPPAEPSRTPIVGWIGSRATLPYLEHRTLVLSALATAGYAFQLRVIADVAPQLPPGIAVDFRPWTPTTWRKDLLGTAFGLAPLPDDAWARGKCGLRILQFTALARPVVASAVGVQTEQVQHGETGYLSRGRESFLQGFEALLTGDVHRRQLGEAAWAEARMRWSVAAWEARVVALVEDLLAQPARSRA